MRNNANLDSLSWSIIERDLDFKQFSNENDFTLRV